MDVMGGIWLTDGRELKAVTGIDDHSRLVWPRGWLSEPTPLLSAGCPGRPGSPRHP